MPGPCPAFSFSTPMSALSGVILAKLASSCGTQSSYIAYSVAASIDAQDIASITFTHSEDGKGEFNEVRSFKLGPTRTVEMKSKASAHTVLVIWGSASIKLRFASRESQLRWALGLQPTSGRTFSQHTAIPRASTISTLLRPRALALPAPGRERTETNSTVASGGSSLSQVLAQQQQAINGSNETDTAMSFTKEHTYVDLEGIGAYDVIPLPLLSRSAEARIPVSRMAQKRGNGHRYNAASESDTTQSINTPIDEEWHQFLSASFSNIIDPPSSRPMLVSVALRRQRSGSSPAVFQREPTP